MQINSTSGSEYDQRLARITDRISNNIAAKVSSDRSEGKRSRSEDEQLFKNVLAEHNISLRFGHDDDTGQIVIKFIDDKNGALIRQIPTEVSLELIRMFERIQGRFISERT